MGKRAVIVYAKFITILATVIIAVMLAYALTGGNSSPIGHTFHACTVVMLPLFIVLDIVAFIYWALIRRRLWALVPLLPLPFCWGYAKTLVRIGGSDKAMHNNVFTVGTYNVRSFSSEATGFMAQDIMTTLSRQNCDVVCLQEYRDDIPGDNSNVRARVRNIYEYSVTGGGDMAIFSRYPIREHKEFKFDYSNNGWQWADIEVAEGYVVRVFNVHMETTGINSALHQLAKENADIDIDDIPMDPDATDTGRSAIGSRMANDRIYRLLLGNYAFGLSVRSGQAITIANEKRQSPNPIILAGDFNDVPYSFTYKTLLAGLTDAFTTGGHGFGATYRGARGLFRIDYIFADQHIQCFDYQTLDLTYSDHRPVVAKFDIGSGK
ncbi:MAG: endonuclease/exonuclease/phosphatase family protein [Bacteroidaceae bacterium]|nr:endonuclease/exonuclease/phosphatase family protein [Bacteroidaceae bacterium]